MSERAKQAQVTQWNQHTYWANPKIPSVGDKFVVFRDAKSLMLKDSGEVLLQDTEGRVWTFYESMQVMQIVGGVFLDSDDSDAVLVEVVENPNNPKWKSIRAKPYKGKPAR